MMSAAVPSHHTSLRAALVVAEHDLSLAKLYEGHTDALAILQELQDPVAQVHGNTWGVWAAESPQGRVTLTAAGNGRVLLHGTKCWCCGASHLSHGLLTAWGSDDKRPQLVRVAMAQEGAHWVRRPFAATPTLRAWPPTCRCSCAKATPSATSQCWHSMCLRQKAGTGTYDVRSPHSR